MERPPSELSSGSTASDFCTPAQIKQGKVLKMTVHFPTALGMLSPKDRLLLPNLKLVPGLAQSSQLTWAPVTSEPLPLATDNLLPALSSPSPRPLPPQSAPRGHDGTLMSQGLDV